MENKRSGPERSFLPLNPSIYCSLKPYQKRSPWKSDCQEAVLMEGELGEKSEVCEMTQEVD